MNTVDSVSAKLAEIPTEEGRLKFISELALANPATILALLDALDEARRDAGRYRWLRDKSKPEICAFYLSVGKAFHKIVFKPETVDEAIDAQIEKDKSHAGTDATKND